MELYQIDILKEFQIFFSIEKKEEFGGCRHPGISAQKCD